MNNFKPSAATLAPLVLALLTAGGIGLWTSHSVAQDKNAKAAPKPALTVNGHPAAAQRDRQRQAGRQRQPHAAWQEASVGAEANGLRLAEVRVNVGDTVRKGQVLATFAPDSWCGPTSRPGQASLLEAEATAGRSRRQRRTCPRPAGQRRPERAADQPVPHGRADRAGPAWKPPGPCTQVQQVRLTQASVLAPDDGVISARMATVGAVVGAGTELFRMIRKGRLEWRAEVTSAELGRVTKGTPAQVTAASGARLEGRVRMIGPTVDPQTRNALVYVDVTPLPGNAGAALAGMFARGEFELGATPALTVPQASVVVRDGFSYVYRINPDNRVSQVKVQTGRLAGDRVEITSALPADAKLVASGGGFLNDGDLVRVVTK
jgi:multidrug efflux pump subunit AcrA (membrane-fusion protein)